MILFIMKIKKYKPNFNNMDRRKTTGFKKLLRKYEAMSLSEKYGSCLFWDMIEKAHSFSDWASIYKYGDDSLRKDAQRKMEELFINDNEDSDVQLNIIELFLIIDKADKDDILRKYLEKFNDKDSLLFALEMAENHYFDSYEDTGLISDIRSQLRDEYCRGSDLVIEQHLKYRYKRTEKLRKKSTFNP